MISLSEHIEYLIRRHDCVIVPGWGAFVANYQSARIDAESKQMLPPSRSVGFNSALTHNDGLVASSIARRSGITYDNAVEAIAHEVNALRHQLETDGEIAIGRLGIFHRNENGTAIFEPSKATDSKFYGLSAIKAIPLIDLAKQEQEDDSSGENTRDVFYLPISRNIFKVAASIALIIGLGLTLSTPIMRDDNSTFASVATPTITKVQEFKLTERNNAELFISMPDCSVAETIIDIEPTKLSVVDTSVATTIRLNESDPYCLVVASHATRQQAEKQIAGNPNLRILESGGRFRVYAATGKSIDEARQPLNQSDFANNYPDAWVCRR